jgi:ATP-dependent exoDNAse (exonuclease V) alpha subunit
VYPLSAPLIAASSIFVPRGTLATLRSVDGCFVTVDSGTATVRVPRAEFSAAFDLAYCVTIHRSQCETIGEPYAVLDSRRIVSLSPAYARALLYVAASRATHAHFVRFGH